MTQFPLASPKEPPQGVAPSSSIAPSNGTSQPVPESPSCYNSRLFRSIVKGASDFKCKHCGEAFTKLENLTKHMYAKEWFHFSILKFISHKLPSKFCFWKSRKGHFTEKEQEPSATGRKVQELSPVAKKIKENPEPDTSAARVLSCLRCGASFESLQDLSCHMVKTKHHEAIPR